MAPYHTTSCHQLLIAWGRTHTTTHTDVHTKTTRDALASGQQAWFNNADWQLTGLSSYTCNITTIVDYNYNLIVVHILLRSMKMFFIGDRPVNLRLPNTKMISHCTIPLGTYNKAKTVGETSSYTYLQLISINQFCRQIYSYIGIVQLAV